MKENELQNLAEALCEELIRVREILTQYKEIGSAGIFGATMIELSLQKADKAIMSGDLVSIIRSYNDLREIQ